MAAACDRRRWLADPGHRPLLLQVDLLPRAERRKRVSEVLKKHGIDPGLIEIELTEGLVMEDTEAAQMELSRLKNIGLRISIDDFGTGYSCLSYLRRFPIDVLKIDRSFVQEIGSSRDGESIIDAIISLARSLRLETVAEGVETAAQLNYLLDHGCHVVQGYLFGKPVGRKLHPTLLAALDQGDTDSSAVRRVPEDWVTGFAQLGPELQRTLEASGVGVYSFDAATGRFAIDATCRRLFDLDPEAHLSPEVMATRIHPDDLERYWAAAADSMQTGAFACDYRVVHRNGAVLFVSGRGYLQPGAPGAPPALHGVCIDVTTHRPSRSSCRPPSHECRNSPMACPDSLPTWTAA